MIFLDMWYQLYLMDAYIMYFLQDSPENQWNIHSSKVGSKLKMLADALWVRYISCKMHVDLVLFLFDTFWLNMKSYEIRHNKTNVVVF